MKRLTPRCFHGLENTFHFHFSLSTFHFSCVKTFRPNNTMAAHDGSRSSTAMAEIFFGNTVYSISTEDQIFSISIVFPVNQ